MTREEWLKWRQQGIGASDSPAILGVSPYKTALDIYESKIASEVKEERSYAMDQGNLIEPRLRALFEVISGRTYTPRLLQMTDNPWLRASLDGSCEDSILEIKLMGAKEHGTLPAKYFPQLQHQLLLASYAKLCYFISYPWDRRQDPVINPEHLSVIEVAPDKAYQEQLFETLRHFWFENVMKRIPPPLVEKDFKSIKSAANKKDASELRALFTKLVSLAEKSGYTRCRIDDVFLQKNSEGNWILCSVST